MVQEPLVRDEIYTLSATAQGIAGAVPFGYVRQSLVIMSNPANAATSLAYWRFGPNPVSTNAGIPLVPGGAANMSRSEFYKIPSEIVTALSNAAGVGGVLHVHEELMKVR